MATEIVFSSPWPEFGPMFGIEWPAAIDHLPSILASRTDGEFSMHEIARIAACKNEDGSSFVSSPAGCAIQPFHGLREFRKRVIAGGRRHNKKQGITGYQMPMKAPEVAPKSHRGRPKGSKGDTRTGIEREIKGGGHNEDIADMFGVESDYVAKIKREMVAEGSSKAT